MCECHKLFFLAPQFLSHFSLFQPLVTRRLDLVVLDKCKDRLGTGDTICSASPLPGLCHVGLLLLDASSGILSSLPRFMSSCDAACKSPAPASSALQQENVK